MTPNTRFADLLSDIEPSQTTKANSTSAHNNVRDALLSDDDFACRVERIFLGGSYKRATAIRPRTKNESTERPDVDLYVVVDANPSDLSPADLTGELFDALNRNRVDLGITKLKRNRVSISVSMKKADLDISILLERQNDGLYRIGNSSTEVWYATDPEEHSDWSSSQNARFGKRFKPMVKLLKWARRENRTIYKHPKSFALEAFIALHSDENESHYGILFHDFCSKFVAAYDTERLLGQCPWLQDPAIATGNLLPGVSGSHFCAYYDKIKQHRDDAEKALAEENQDKATEYWRRIFGSRFPAGKAESAKRSTLRPAAAVSPLTFTPTQALPSPRPAKFA